MKSLRALRAALPHSPPASLVVPHKLHPIKCPCPPCGGTSGSPGTCPDPCGNNRNCCGETPPPPPKPVCPPAPPAEPLCPPDPCLKKNQCPPKKEPCPPKKDQCPPKKDPCPPKKDPCPPKGSGKNCITPMTPTPEDCARMRVGVFCRIEAARAARQAAYEAEARCRQPAQPPGECCYAPLVAAPRQCVEPLVANLSARARHRCPPPEVLFAAAPPGVPPPPAVCTLRSPRYLARFPDPPLPVRTCAAAGSRNPCARLPYSETAFDNCAMPDSEADTCQRRAPCAEPRGGRCDPRAGDDRRAFQPPRPQPCPPAVRYPYRPARYPQA